MARLLSFTLFFISVHILQAQEFVKVYGNTQSNIIENAIYSEYFKSYYAFGTTNDNLPTISRLDRNGNVVWTRSYTSGIYASDIVELPIRGQAQPDLAVCMSRSGSFDDIIVMRIRGNDGTVVWSYVYEPSSSIRFSHLVATSDSNLIITGTYGGNSGTFYAKLDPNGNALWGKRYSTSPDQFAATGDIYPTKNGGVIGSCAGTNKNGFFIVDGNGNVTNYKTTTPRLIFRRIEGTNNGFIVATIQDWANRSKDQGILRLDENLNVLWSRRVNPVIPFNGGCSNCASPAVAQTPNGNFIYVQETGLSGRIAYSVLKFSSTGQLLQSRTFNNPDVFFTLLKTTRDGNILITGSTTRVNLCMPNNSRNGVFGVTTEDLNICEMTNISPLSENWNINLQTQPTSAINVSNQTVSRTAFSSNSTVITFNQSEFCEDVTNKVDLGPDIQACSGPVTLNAGTGFNTYQWSTGAITQSINVNTGGTYFVTVTTVCGTTLRDTITVTIGAGSNTIINASICQGRSYTLPNGTIVSAGGSYPVTLTSSAGCDSVVTTNLSVVNTINSSISVNICQGENYQFGNQQLNTTGVYTRTLTSAGGCDSIVTLNLTVSPLPVIQINTDINPVPPGTIVVVSVQGQGNYQYLWQSTNELSNTEGTSTSTGIIEDTWIYVTATDGNGCTKRDSILIRIVREECSEENVFIPTAFTPNGDGVNDILFVRSSIPMTELKLMIYNRWGEKVFETTEQQKGWNGVFRDNPSEAGVYSYYLEGICGETIIERKGSITLIR